MRIGGILRGYKFNVAAIMALLNMIIFSDCYMLDRYLSTHDLFTLKRPHIYYNATAFHTPPAELLMQTITVCGLHYCKHEFLPHCDFISSTLIIKILSAQSCQHTPERTVSGSKKKKSNSCIAEHSEGWPEWGKVQASFTA